MPTNLLKLVQLSAFSFSDFLKLKVAFKAQTCVRDPLMNCAITRCSCIKCQKTFLFLNKQEITLRKNLRNISQEPFFFTSAILSPLCFCSHSILL